MGTESRAVSEQLPPGEAERLAPFLAALNKDLFAPFGTGGSGRIFSLCVQAPPELFHAAGGEGIRLACGSFAAKDAAPRHLPALACPMIKSLAGLLALEEGSQPLNLVLPFTCDWVVKFPELTGLEERARIHFMELPHLREGEAAAGRWAGEIMALKLWIEAVTGRKITRKRLLSTVNASNGAAVHVEELAGLRREGRVPARAFALVMNAFSRMDITDWTVALKAYIRDCPPPERTGPSVFLTGSPVVFPNYKLLRLIEEAGMVIAGDDICTLERAFPGTAALRDPSEYSLIRALADRHHRACSCPSFADNRRRANRLVARVREDGLAGVVFHVLKGCHPFDMEAGLMEQRLRAEGIRFLKVETDYVTSDVQNIVTRLEAFARSLGQ